MGHDKKNLNAKTNKSIAGPVTWVSQYQDYIT